MSLARRHRDRIAARLAAGGARPHLESKAPEPSPEPTPGSPIPPFAGAGGHPGRSSAAAQIMLRLTHDLRRLKEIQSIERKIDAKREMLPEYAAWSEGLLAAAEENGVGVADEILPTVMIWRIDTGDYAGALPLAAHVLQYDLPLPGRYNRTAAPLIVEEIADAALVALGRGDAFDLAILQQVEELTASEDIFDEVRAKLMKAIGLEFVRQADAEEAASQPDQAVVLRVNARHALGRARDLHGRCGVTKTLEKLDRALRPVAAEQDPGN
jgi:hypothetical protein